MNLNQSAHGDREFGFIMSRMRLDRKVITGHWQDPETLESLNTWSRAPATGCARLAGSQIRPLRRQHASQVAVTEGDKESRPNSPTSAAPSIPTASATSSKVINGISDLAVDHLVKEYDDRYTVAPSRFAKVGPAHSSPPRMPPESGWACAASFVSRRLQGVSPIPSKTSTA